jgi:purine-nucleoside/S-methyl-5'-thioadenosine phosphorylase / adenosine deaminase
VIRWDGDHLTARLGDARVLFTTRRGGVSQGPFSSLNLGGRTGDDPADVAANVARLREFAGGAQLARCHQVHGGAVVREPDPGTRPEADGIATRRPGVAAVVLAADCLPVALHAPGAVAMVHAGWRGLAAGVLAEGVRALRELGADGPVSAAIGPGAGACCYEAGEEVHAALEARADERDGGRLDLAAVARRRLRAAGVGDVHVTGLCTMCATVIGGDAPLFFSHRRDGGVTGRQAGIARRA